MLCYLICHDMKQLTFYYYSNTENITSNKNTTLLIMNNE